MKVQQVTWFHNTPSILFFNTMACFKCQGKCQHYHLTPVDYDRKKDMPVLPATPVQSSPILPVTPVQLSAKDDSFDGPSSNIDRNPAVSESFNEGDWVVVCYVMTEKKSERKWIGKIHKINENNEYFITFVRPTQTKSHSGYVYVYPSVADEETVCKTQIMYSISEPTLFQRKLLFSVHYEHL